MTKPQTQASYEARLDRVTDYIYEHLEEDIDPDRLAEVACLSPYHWHRIYAAMRGETISATVRRLRLLRAADRLANSDMPVRTIAERAGYSTANCLRARVQGCLRQGACRLSRQWQSCGVQGRRQGAGRRGLPGRHGDACRSPLCRASPTRAPICRSTGRWAGCSSELAARKIMTPGSEDDRRVLRRSRSGAGRRHCVHAPVRRSPKMSRSPHRSRRQSCAAASMQGCATRDPMPT